MDLSEVNILLPESRGRFRQLPPGLCVLPDSRLRLNINTLAQADLPQLWAVLEGQVSLVALADWWQRRPEIGYAKLDDFWEDLGLANLPPEPEWQARVGANLMFVSDFYRLSVAMLLHNLNLEFETEIYLAPNASTQVYARRFGPVDGRQPQGGRLEQDID